MRKGGRWSQGSDDRREEKGLRTISGLKETRELEGQPVKGGLMGEQQLSAGDVGSRRECGQCHNSRGSETRNRDPVASGDLTGGQSWGRKGDPAGSGGGERRAVRSPTPRATLQAALSGQAKQSGAGDPSIHTARARKGVCGVGMVTPTS